MLKVIEGLGASLLSRFVPEIEAAAAHCWPGHWPHCWQCNNRPCNAVHCDDGNDYDIQCL
ncbi:hypothetical protein [Nocardia arthritidis]|uniref:Uncharacterized protein n=1 Tax=Nocardia arthritidis TaxID=228602 RepID=A0A6G9Y434_9NOCA|nr:hypothetical protein [Nocardia arthritidis]QIS07978.1 hypothetical protein F5544_00215 [Nocardia arthritidis]